MMTARESANGKKYSEGVYAWIKQQVINGFMLPGERILEDEVARTFNISKTPVREALSRLAGDGLVESKGRYGTYVAKLSDDEVIELYETRAVVEPALAQWAAERGNEEGIFVLEKCVKLQKEALKKNDDETFLIQDRLFHQQIALMAKNSLLLGLRATLSNKIALMQVISFHHLQRYRTSLKEHEMILRAIKRRDGDKAWCSMAKHLENLKDERVRIIKSRESMLTAGNE
jgi:DNA-binding GntR family transcriptional regulator